MPSTANQTSITLSLIDLQWILIENLLSLIRVNAIFLVVFSVLRLISRAEVRTNQAQGGRSSLCESGLQHQGRCV